MRMKKPPEKKVGRPACRVMPGRGECRSAGPYAPRRAQTPRNKGGRACKGAGACALRRARGKRRHMPCAQVCM
ncbi:MAG: hypothetical protein DBY17_05005 [Oscillospiraceae bacterium]|nr:MAG: hypothetical protein DBY17_05005 [Oscillospiraceae bacterium]